MSKTIKIGGRIESAEQGGIVTGANAILDDTKGKKQNVINSETDAELSRLDNAKQDVLTFDNAPTEGSNNPVKSGGVYAADAALQQAIEAILQLIPSAATAMNQLADKAFVNSTEATNTATFRGTYNVVTDLSLHYNSTHQEIATALLSVVQTADNNDYCFVQIPVSDSSGDIRVTERYKFNGTAWSYEYDLNNSGFTADQWAAINSTITLALVQKLGALPTAAELAQQLALKQNTLTFDTAPVAGSSNPVTSGGLYNVIAAINATIPSGASVDNKLVAESRLTQYVAAIVNALDATFNVTSTDGHVNVRLTQVDGAITSVEAVTNDIASASALNTLAGRVTTNEGDIAQLQAAYNALQQSAPVIIQPTDTWPVANPSATVIYRVIDRVNTPPQYYSDYMFSASDLTPVLMATYNNAIDPRPKKGSQNLVTSGGVFDNMGALDVSELNATENPHTIATYADLSTALAAIPSDYQKGGMSIKYVQSSDNKYVQYRLTSDSFNTTTANWQGVVNQRAIYEKNLNIDGALDINGFKNLFVPKYRKGNKGTIPTADDPTGSRYDSTQLITIQQGHKYKYQLFAASTDIYIIAEYDSNDTLITASSIKGGVGLKTDVYIPSSSAVKVVLCNDGSSYPYPAFIDITNNIYAFNDYVNSVKQELNEDIEDLQNNTISDNDLSYVIVSNNIANPANIFDGGIGSTGNLNDGTGLPEWKAIAIPVTEGQVLSFGGFYLGRQGYAQFYNGNTKVGNVIQYNDPNGSALPATQNITVPQNATVFYIDIQTNQSTTPEGDNTPYDKLMVNIGALILPYDSFEKKISEINGIEISGADETLEPRVNTLEGTVSQQGNDITNLGLRVTALENTDIIEDLPVSDGTDISVGYAYIDSTTGVVKVKLS